MEYNENYSTLPWADNPWDEIVPNLWIGGMVYGERMTPCIPKEFDVCISMAGNEVKPEPGIVQYVYSIPDNRLGFAEKLFVKEAVIKAEAGLLLSGRVLVRCYAGYNRSGLVVALTLLNMGYSPAAAIDLIREKRSPHALCNEEFVKYVYEGL